MAQNGESDDCIVDLLKDHQRVKGISIICLPDPSFEPFFCIVKGLWLTASAEFHNAAICIEIAKCSMCNLIDCLQSQPSSAQSDIDSILRIDSKRD